MEAGLYQIHSHISISVYLMRLVIMEIALLSKGFPETPEPPSIHPCTSPILMNSIKNYQKLVKISHYIFSRLVVQNCYAQWTSPIPRQGWFFNWISKWYFSKYYQMQTRWIFTQTVTYVLATKKTKSLHKKLNCVT